MPVGDYPKRGYGGIHGIDAQGQQPAPNLPLQDYQQLTVAQIYDRLDKLSKGELKQVRAYEAAHKKRKGVLEELNDRLK